MRRRPTLLLATLAILAVTGCDWLWREPTKVRVRNATGTDIHGLRLTVKGDEGVIGDLSKSETRAVTLKPQRDSDLVLSFSEGATGRTCRQKPDVYLDLGGSIDLDLLTCETHARRR